MSNHIGTLREQGLHAALKQHLAQAGDRFEQEVDGYQVDILRGDLLIEIQTGNFSALRRKLAALLEEHHVLLVYPIAQSKWILRQDNDGRQVARRKSPKRGRVEDIFEQLLYIPAITAHPNFAFKAVLTEQEEVWRDDGAGSWRRKHWSITERRLLEVVAEHDFTDVGDYLRLLPPGLGTPFTHKQLAEALGATVRQSTRISYCLRKMGLLEECGWQGRELLLATSAHKDE
ncbi:MAG: hypothetical protein KIS85_04115 [Anaerolineales bacterium]|nr:hypothetical protein [Anaerolineales bacterium]